MPGCRISGLQASPPLPWCRFLPVCVPLRDDGLVTFLRNQLSRPLCADRTAGGFRALRLADRPQRSTLKGLRSHLVPRKHSSRPTQRSEDDIAKAKLATEVAVIKSFLRSWQREVDLGGRSLGIDAFLVCLPRGRGRSQEASLSSEDGVFVKLSLGASVDPGSHGPATLSTAFQGGFRPPMMWPWRRRVK